MNFSEKEMEGMLRESIQKEDQLIVHIVGDRTTESFLTAMENTGGRGVWSNRRVRIEHGTGIMPDLVPRVKEMGVVVVKNPMLLTLRRLFVERFGAARTDQMQPLRSLLDAGIPIAIGSDDPWSEETWFTMRKWCRHADPPPAHQGCKLQAAANTQQNSQDREAHACQHDHSTNILRARSERIADTVILRPVLHGGRHQAVNTDRPSNSTIPAKTLTRIMLKRLRAVDSATT